METFDPDEVIADVESTRADRQERAVCALEWFRDRDGLLPRGEAGQQIAETHGWSEAAAQTAIGDVVSDLVDPVQQVKHPEQGKFVGIIEYHERPESGCYGYVDYDDVDGRRKRAVCSQCVIEADTDSEVAHATTGEGSTPSDAPWETLYATVVDHYENAHSVEPSEVEVGASLVSGTTVAGNTVFHDGNVTAGENITIDNRTISASAQAKAVQRDAQGTVQLSQAATASGSPAAQTTLSGNVQFTEVSVTGSAGPATLTLNRDTTQLQAGSLPLTTSGTPRTPSPVFSVTGPTKTTVTTRVVDDRLVTTGGSATSAISGQVGTSASRAELRGYFSRSRYLRGTFSLLINGSQKATATRGTTGAFDTVTLTTATNLTPSDTLTARVHGTSGLSPMYVRSVEGSVSAQVSPTASLVVSTEDTVTIT